MVTIAAIQRLHLNCALGTREIYKTDSSKRWTRLKARASGGDNNENTSDDSSESKDWDKLWTSYKSGKKQRPLFDLNMEQYVSRKPAYREYPLNEEVDTFRKIERSNLQVWTDPKFTYAGFSVIFGMFLYMVINSPLT